MINDPDSAVPTTVGVVSFVKYGLVLSHPILVTAGALGAVVSNIAATVPVPLFPAGSVTVTTGLLPNNVPLQVTVPPVLGVGVHVNHTIVYVSPLVVPVKVITTAPLVGFGVAIPVGTLGAVLSTVKLKLVAELVFPAASVAVTVPAYVPSTNAGLIVIL